MSEKIKEIRERWSYPNADKLDWNNAKDDIDSCLSHISTLEERVNHYQSHYEATMQMWKQEQEKVRRLEERETNHLKQLNEILDRSILHIKRAEQAESRIQVLEEAIDRHEEFKRSHNKVVSLEDEELYKALKGVKR